MKRLIFLLLIIMLAMPAYAGMKEDVKVIESRIKNFTGQDENTAIVIGERASFAQKFLYNYLKENDARIKDFPLVKNISGYDSVMLVGGSARNSVTREVLDKYEVAKKEDYSTVSIYYIDSDKKIMIFTEKDNLPARTSAEKSPLAKIMPVEYVPAAATVIGLGLLWLWKFLLLFFKKILRLSMSSKIMKHVNKKELKEKYKGFHIFGVRIKYREWISIFLAALIFALAIGYTYLNMQNAVLFLGVHVFVNFVIYAIRHFTRLFMDKRHTLHTEYVFWIWGAVLTVITGWLGNTFSMAGYTVSAGENKKEAKIQYTIDLLTFLAAIIFLAWNYLAPNELLSMAAILALALSTIQMLPFAPFGGKKVWKWSKWRYLVLFVPIIIVYLVVNFLL